MVKNSNEIEDKIKETSLNITDQNPQPEENISIEKYKELLREYEKLQDRIKNRDDVIKNQYDVIKNKDDVIKKKDDENKKQANIIKNLKFENAAYIKENKKIIKNLLKLQVACNNSIQKTINKNETIKVNAYNTYVNKADRMPEKELPSEPHKHIDNSNVKTDSTKRRGRKKGGKNFANADFEVLVTETIDHYPEDSECPTCGSTLTDIGNPDVKLVVSATTINVKVVKHVYHKLKCTKCNKIFQVQSFSGTGHCIFDSSFAALLINTKLTMCCPINRIQKVLANKDINISVQCLNQFFVRSGESLSPISDLIKANLVTHNETGVVYSDETTFKLVKNEPERKTSYVYIILSSYKGHPISVYDFKTSRTTEYLESYLKDFKGYVICDGFTGYNKLTEGGQIKLQRCWAHVRRKFVDVLKVLPEDKRIGSKAQAVVWDMDRILDTEANFREQSLSPSHIFEKRNSPEYLKMISHLKKLVDSIKPPKGSKLDAAIVYLRKYWNELLTYLEDGNIEMTNNKAERAVKPFAIGRKNYLFAREHRGAIMLTNLFTIIETAKANSLNADAYIKFLLDEVSKPTPNYIDLLPWSDTIPDDIRIKQ